MEDLSVKALEAARSEKLLVKVYDSNLLVSEAFPPVI